MNAALEAAYQVLEEAGEPLNYKEIARRAIRKKGWVTKSRDPGGTLYAQLSVDLQKHGKKSRFRKVGRGVFALSNRPPEPPPEPATPERMSFTDAAEKVLGLSTDRQPLHYREITRRALKHGFIKSGGRTPEATMYASIYGECQNRAKRGERQRFERSPRGMVALVKWQPSPVVRQIEQHNGEIRKKLLDAIQSAAPASFETLVGELLAALGFEDVEVTRLHRDGGVDVRGTLVVGDSVRTKMAVQAKKWSVNVQSPAVQQLRGSLGAHEQGLIVTTSAFSAGARQEANRADAVPIGLMNGKQFVSLMIEHEIGVTKNKQDVLELALHKAESTE